MLEICFPQGGEKSVDSVCYKTKTQLKQKRSKGIGKDKVRKMLIRKEALEPVGCWEGPGLQAKMRISGRAHAHQFPLVPWPPESLSPQCPCPHSVLAPTESQSRPHLPRRPSRSADRPDSGSSGVTALAGSQRTWNFVRCREWNLFPQSCGAAALKPCWPSKPEALGGSFSQPQTHRLGHLTWGSGLSLL